MTTESKNFDHLDTLSRGLALLRHFGNGRPELSIQEAADLLQISRGAARRFLITLANEGYVDRKKRNFHISPKVLELGYSYFSSMDLPGIAAPVLDGVSERTGETCGLYVLHEQDIVTIGASGGRQNFTFTPRRGSTFPAYATAVGRLLLSDLPSAELDAYLAKVQIMALTPYTIKSVSALRKAIIATRREGYAVVTNELAYGMAGVALPICDANGRYVAAVNISLQRGGTPEDMIQVCKPALAEAAAKIGEILTKLGRQSI